MIDLVPMPGKQMRRGLVGVGFPFSLFSVLGARP